jgi:hypothetical protein
MNIFKLILIIFAVVLTTFAGLALVGMAVSLLKSVFWLAVIAGVVYLLWKLFADKGEALISGDDAGSKILNAEMTLEEYKRKIEDQLNRGTERRS